MKIEERDITQVESGFLCHQVNCRKAMGAGLALQIKNKWPVVFEQYMKFEPKLGDIDIVSVVFGKLWVVNVYGQDRPGTLSRKTNYGAFGHALYELRRTLPSSWITIGSIYFPWGIGCGRGGGDWAVVSEIIEFYFPEAIICKLAE